jgi:MFS family permease
MKLLYASAILTLIALGLMVWSLFAPTPLPVMVAMTVGQALGTAAFGAYGYVVVMDILKLRRAKRDPR